MGRMAKSASSDWNSNLITFMEGFPKDLIVYIARRGCIRDRVALFSVSKRFRVILKDIVNGEKVGYQHLKWMKQWKRREKSMLRSWCYTLRKIKRVTQVRSILHIKLSGNTGRLCNICLESITLVEVDCFIDWWMNKNCLRCTRSAENGLILDGSGDESA